MMTSRSILKKIKVEDLPAAFNEVQIFVTNDDVMCSDVGDILRSLYFFISPKENSKDDDKLLSLTSDLISIISLCINLSEKRFSFEEISNNKFFNSLYHITKILLKLAIYDGALACVECVQKLFHKFPDSLEDLKIIINNLVASLWNESLEAEKNLSCATAFKLRRKCFELQALYDVTKVLETLPPTLKRYFQNCKPDTSSELIDFLSIISKQINLKKSDFNDCLNLLKFLSSVLEVIVKFFQLDVATCHFFLNWISDISEAKFPKNSKQRVVKICCEVLRHTLRVLVLRENSVLLKTKLSQFEKIVAELKCENMFEVDFFSSTLSTFQVIFNSNFELESNEENLNHLSKAHIEFCTAMCRCYLNMPSLPHHKELYMFSVTADAAISSNLVKLLRLLIKKEEGAAKKSELILIVQKFVKYAISKLELKFSSYPSKKGHSRFAYAVRSLGYDFYYSEDYNESCFFLEVATDLMTKFSVSELVDENIMLTLWKMRNSLIYLYNCLFKYDKALQTIGLCMINHSDRMHECMKLWIKVKKSAVSANNEEVIHWTISDVLQDIEADVSESTEIDLLMEELRKCSSERNFVEEEIIAIVNRFSKLQCPDTFKAAYLTEILMLPPTIVEKVCESLKLSVSEMCLEIIKLLKGHLKDNPKDNKAKLQISIAHFWLYHSQSKLLQKFAEEEASNCLKPSSDVRNDDNEEIDVCDIAPTFPLLTLSVEIERLQNLDHALDLWTEISQDSVQAWSTLSGEVNLWNVLTIINTTAEVYATSIHDLKELRCLLLIRSIASLIGNKEKEICSSLSLIQFLLRFGYLKLASHLLKHVEALFPKEEDCSFSLQVLKLKSCLSTSHVLYHERKFDEGLLLLQEVIENPLLERYYKSTKVLLIEALLLKSKFLRVSNVAYSDTKNIKYLLTQTEIIATLEATALAKGLLKSSSNEDSENCQTNWMNYRAQLLKYILMLFLQLGELFFQNGNIRYARCYLQEGLRMSQSNLLTYWSSKILLLLGQIDLLCDNVKDCAVKLYGLKYIMDETKKENISSLLSNLEKTNMLETRGSSENFFLEHSEILEPKRDVKQHFIDTSNVASSPVQKKKGKSLEFEVKTPTGFTKGVMSAYTVKLEIWYLSCLQLLTEGDTSVAETQLSKLLKTCKNLKNLFNISEMLDFGNLNVSLKNLQQKYPSGPEVILPVVVMYQLSLVQLLKNDFEGVISTTKQALNVLNTSFEKPKYIYSWAYGMLLLNNTVASLKKKLSIKGNSNVEFCSVPSVKNNIFVRKSATLENLSVCQTPPRYKPIPEIVVTTPVVNKKNVCKAPVKKEILPQHMAKDLKELPSLTFSCGSDDDAFITSTKNDKKLFGTPVKTDVLPFANDLKQMGELPALLFSSSSDDDVFATDTKNTPKLFGTPTKNAKEPKTTYKFFKTKSENVKIESSCDVWKYSVSYTQKGKKNTGKTKTVNLKNKSQKTRMKAKVEFSSSLVRAPKKVYNKTSKDEFNIYEEESFLSPLKGSIEQTRSSAEKKKKCEDDFPHDVMRDAAEEKFSSNLEGLCQDLSSIDITKDSLNETFIKIPENDLKIFIDDLSNIKELIHHNMPYPLYRDVCKLLAILNLAKNEGSEVNNPDKLNEIGFYLSQTVSTSYGQAYLNNILYPKDKRNDRICDLLKVTDSSLINKMELYLSTIPNDWTVVQINAVPDKDWLGGVYQQPTFSKLIITQYSSKSSPLVICVDSSTTGGFIFGLLTEYQDILLQSSIIMKKTNNHKKWWQTRSSLDARLKSLLSSMENSWLGCWKGLLLGTPVSEERKEQLMLSVNKISEISKPSDERLLRILLDSASFLKREQLAACICHLWSCKPHHEIYSILFKAVIEESKKSTTKRNPVVLLLDKDIQALPWESIPILSGNPITRMPSLGVLSAHLSLHGEDSIFHKGVDCNKTYYLLNPKGDLLYSQKTFEEKFKLQPNWKGIVARIPESTEFLEALKENDLFLYIGHGSGRQYIENNLVHKLECNAAVVLMGCSSGSLMQSGRRFEAEGFPLRCLMQGSPCVIGNLWDITDKDIDRFTDKFLELFVPNYYKSKSAVLDVSNSVSQARVACKMSYLTGAAPVIYGFPTLAER